MTKAHLEQRLKDLQGNRSLMRKLYYDDLTHSTLKKVLMERIIVRNREVKTVIKELAALLTPVLVPLSDNVFFEHHATDFKQESR